MPDDADGPWPPQPPELADGPAVPAAARAHPDDAHAGARSLQLAAQVGSPRPHLRRDRTRPGRICVGTWLAPATSALGPGSFRPHPVCVTQIEARARLDQSRAAFEAFAAHGEDEDEGEGEDEDEQEEAEVQAEPEPEQAGSHIAPGPAVNRIANPCHTSRRPVPCHAGPVQCPQWRPDGARACVGAGGAVRRQGGPLARACGQVRG